MQAVRPARRHRTATMVSVPRYPQPQLQLPRGGLENELDLRRRPALTARLRIALGPSLCQVVEELAWFGYLGAWTNWIDHAGLSRRPSLWSPTDHQRAAVMADHLLVRARSGPGWIGPALSGRQHGRRKPPVKSAAAVMMRYAPRVWYS